MKEEKNLENFDPNSWTDRNFPEFLSVHRKIREEFHIFFTRKIFLFFHSTDCSWSILLVDISRKESLGNCSQFCIPKYFNTIHLTYLSTCSLDSSIDLVRSNFNRSLQHSELKWIFSRQIFKLWTAEPDEEWTLCDYVWTFTTEISELCDYKSVLGQLNSENANKNFFKTFTRNSNRQH